MNKQTIKIKNREHLLLKADVFRVLSKGFAYPSEVNQKDVTNIIHHLLKNEDLDTKTKILFSKILEEQKQSDIVTSYSDMFMKGNVPSTEGYCCSRIHSTSDVSAFYKAFGMHPKSGENPDAINYELEFVALLLVKMALAENEDQYEITLDAYGKFLKDHLIDFSLQFTEKLKEAEPIPYYDLMLQLLNLWVVDRGLED